MWHHHDTASWEHDAWYIHYALHSHIMISHVLRSFLLIFKGENARAPYKRLVNARCRFDCICSLFLRFAKKAKLAGVVDIDEWSFSFSLLSI